MRHRLLGLAAAVLAGGLSACAPAQSAVEPTAPTPAPTTDSPTLADPDAQPGGAPEGADAEPAPTTSLFVRPERELTDELVAAVAGLEGVDEVFAPRRDDLSLVSSTTPDGVAFDTFPDGFRVLVSAAIADGDLSEDLGPGEVLLTEVGAALRDLPNGSSVTFAGHPGLVVAGRTDAGGGAEFIVHPDDAVAVGIGPPERLFITLLGDADPDAVAAAVTDVLGDQAFVRVRLPRDDDGRPFILRLADTKVRFGEFAFRDLAGSRDIDQEDAWIDANVVTARVPLLGEVVCHRGIIDDLEAALLAIEAAGLADEIRPAEYAGCWYPRRTSEGGNLSKHAWGIAVDINVDLSLPGGGEIPHPGVIEAFEQAGFRWGGDFPTPDNHHFEWVGRAEG